MAVWRIVVLVVSLVLAGPGPVFASAFPSAPPMAAEQADEPCHHEEQAQGVPPACCAGLDAMAHCAASGCLSACMAALPSPCGVVGPVIVRRHLPSDHALHGGRVVAPEPPPPTL